MNWRRTLSVVRKEWRHISRDRASFIILLLSPVLFLTTMGYAFSIDIKNVDVGILDLDLSQQSRDYIAQLGSTDSLRLSDWPASVEELDRSLLRGRIRAAIIIAPGFADELQTGGPIDLQIIIDGTDPNTAGHAIREITAHTEHFVRAAIGPQAPRSRVDLRLRAWYNPSLRHSVSMVPALVGVALSVPAMAASLALAREREWGTLEGLIATPIRRGELVLGKLIPYVLAGVFSVPLCIVTAVYGYGVPFRGHLVIYLALCVLFLVATMSIALFISILVKSQQAAMISSMIIFLFSGFFLSGLLIPFSIMGPLIQAEALLFPTTHLVIISRSFFVKGSGLYSVRGYVAALAVIAGAFMSLAALTFKKKL